MLLSNLHCVRKTIYFDKDIYQYVYLNYYNHLYKTIDYSKKKAKPEMTYVAVPFGKSFVVLLPPCFAIPVSKDLYSFGITLN